MKAISDIFTREGYRVFCPPLTGHHKGAGNLTRQKEITSYQWVMDFRKYYEYLTSVTDDKINIAAFSLGGAVALNYIVTHKPDNIGSVLLMEPATHLSLPLKLLIWLSRLLKLSPTLGIPSSNLPDYRVEASTSIAAYQALSAFSFDRIKYSDASYMKGIRALVIIESKSEAISQRKAKHDFEGVGWKVMSVTNHKKNNIHPVFKWITPTIHHLIIDSRVTHAQCWNQINEAITEHLHSSS